MCCNDGLGCWGVARSAKKLSDTGSGVRCCWCCWCCCFALRGGRRLRESFATTRPVCLLCSRGALIAEFPADGVASIPLLERHPRPGMCGERSTPVRFVATPIEAKDWWSCGLCTHNQAHDPKDPEIQTIQHGVFVETRTNSKKNVTKKFVLQ